MNIFIQKVKLKRCYYAKFTTFWQINRLKKGKRHTNITFENNYPTFTIAKSMATEINGLEAFK